MNSRSSITNHRMGPHSVSRPAAAAAAALSDKQRHTTPPLSALSMAECRDGGGGVETELHPTSWRTSRMMTPMEDATNSTSSITKRYLQEENRDLRQHLLVQHELLYQTEKKKSEALLRILRLQDRRWRQENQQLRDQVARLQYELVQQQQQQATRQLSEQLSTSSNATTPGMHLLVPIDEEQTDAAVENNQRGYQTFQACTEKPFGTVVDTEDNGEDELIHFTPPPQQQQQQQKPVVPPPSQKQTPPRDTTATIVWNPFGEDSIVPTAVVNWSWNTVPGAVVQRSSPPSEASESNLDMDDFYDCVSLMSMSYSERNTTENQHEMEENNDEVRERNRLGKYSGKKQRRWKTGACWKKLTT